MSSFISKQTRSCWVLTQTGSDRTDIMNTMLKLRRQLTK